MIRTVVTFRASKTTGEPPRVGDLMASATGKTVFRLLTVTKLRTAGDPSADRFRLTCERLGRSDVPEGVAVHPWRLERRVPPPRRPQAAQEPASTATSMPERPQTASTGRAVPRTRGVRERLVVDFGPALRRRAVRDSRGRLLREADVEMDDQASDPAAPNRRLRRAYRVDPVDTLRRTGSIGPREADAAAELRTHLERVTPTLGCGNALRVSLAAFQVDPISDHQLLASRKLREASAALGERLWPPVLWLCLGGTVREFCEHRRVERHRGADLIVLGMQRLADHLYGSGA
jgi:hypothetical protein